MGMWGFEQNGVYVGRLPFGLPVVVEPLPNTYSVSLAVWLLQGSRDERPDEVGLAHFLEHMFFKGTTHRSVQDIARLLDRIGGRVDAFTTREYVCFYARVLTEHTDSIVELFADLLLNPLFDPVELEKERMVIVEEIRGVDDDPAEFAFDRFAEALWPDHGLGRPIAGRAEQVLDFRRDQLIAFFERQNFPANMLVTAAGAVDPEALYRPLERYFAPLEGRSGQGAERQPPQARPFAQYWHRPGLEQAQVIIGGPGLSIRDPRRHAYALLLSILGGGMSSRLFMKVREERGLVYSIHASIVPYSDAGFWYVTAATMPNRLPELLRVIREELDRIREEPVQPEELYLVQEQSRVNLFMSWESASDRMFTRAKQFVYGEPFQSLEERVREVMAVTVEDTYAVAQQVFQPEALSCLILGDVPPAVIRDLPWPMELERREWPDG